MLRLAEIKQILKPFGIEIENTKRGRHPIKAAGHKAVHIIFALALLTVSEILAASEQDETEKERLSCN